MRAESIMIAHVAFLFYLFERLQPKQLDQCNVKVNKKGDDILQARVNTRQVDAFRPPLLVPRYVETFLELPRL
jgi:hypothetical protein